jgi:uncharacterized protein YeaO (DUF488 family)
MVKLYTNYFNNPALKEPPLDGGLKVGISRRRPPWAKHVGLREEPLAPPGYLLNAYQASEKTPEDIARFQRVYRERLEAFGIDAVKERLEEVAAGAEEAILLCHEKVPEKFCHRRVLAAWFEEQTGEPIEEVV